MNQSGWKNELARKQGEEGGGAVVSLYSRLLVNMNRDHSVLHLTQTVA